MKQDMNAYTAEDFQVWKTLFDRQVENLQTKGSSHYLSALKEMESVLNRQLIPDFRAINGFFQDATGWSIEVVPGLIPVEQFFELLADKKFCSSTWLRTMEQLDYLEEPDMFHDVFGHIPLLSNQIFSAFAHEFGKIGKSLIGNEQALIQLQRLYWFTIEFGVIREDGIIKSYGAGIMSSFGETNRIANKNCEFLEFDIEMVLSKEFWTDRLQEEYVVIDSLNQLFESLKKAQLVIARTTNLVSSK
jgi:phenylalanine-4-hydroxylase